MSAGDSVAARIAAGGFRGVAVQEREITGWHCRRCPWFGTTPSWSDASHVDDDGHRQTPHVATCPHCFQAVQPGPAVRS
jgi:hypothetical protein